MKKATQSPAVKRNQTAMKLAHQQTREQLKKNRVTKEIKVYKPEGKYPDVFQENFKKAVAKLEKAASKSKKATPSTKSKAKSKAKVKAGAKSQPKLKKAAKSPAKIKSKAKAGAKSKK